MSPLQVVTGIIGVVVILSIVGFAAYGFYHLVSLLLHLQKEIAAAIITAAATIIVAVITVVVGRVIERRHAAQRAQQEKRTPIYEEFVDGLLEILGIGKPKPERTAPDPTFAANVFGNFTSKIMVWGSDDVLSAWTAVRIHFKTVGKDSERSEAENYAGLLKLEQLLLALRRDLGLPSNKLPPGQLMSAIVDDLDDIRRQIP